MPIDNRSFENFYQGTCAENYVSSLFYFAGYESFKLSPDAGIDLLVTNIARAKFKSETETVAKIQVKSSILDATGAAFYMDQDELDFLSTADDRFTVFVLLGNFKGNFDPVSFDIYADRVDRAIDADTLRYEEAQMAESGRARKAQGLSSIFDFSQSDFNVFWPNSAQMTRAKNEGIWQAYGDNRFRLQVNMLNETLYAKVPQKNFDPYDSAIVPELREICYIMRPCRSNSRLKDGDFLYDHL
ncbi:hypothetical protein J6356_02640 [Burkholderia pseudomallei]|uniref:hypothetical protein n=1 Tax=Burkholderia pseudomallei TaxID=28450 RepID=UPI001AD69E93|nr:hypothetical protein [Burkholderia pseudomallei]MBO7789557.1 hypothetical protein [Burkholderia pseudomallei]